MTTVRFFFQRKLNILSSNAFTPLNFGVCALRKVPAKRFKLYHILCTYTKTQSCFFRFSFRATLYFPLMNALVYVT